MEVKLLNIGSGNTVIANRVVAIVSPASAPMKRLKEDAKLGNKLIDATMGRRTRSIIVTDSDHVILSGPCGNHRAAASARWKHQRGQHVEAIA